MWKGKWNVGSEGSEDSVVFRCQQYHGIFTKVLGRVDYMLFVTEHTIGLMEMRPLITATAHQYPWLISNLMHKILIYLNIIHLLKSSTCFEHYPAHLQEVYVVIVFMQPLVSSVSADDCPVHRLRKKRSFLIGAQDSHLQRVTIP